MSVGLHSKEVRHLIMTGDVHKSRLGIAFVFSLLLYGCVIPMLENPIASDHELAWRPNSESLVLSGNGLRLYTDNLQTITDLSTNDELEVTGVAWSSDGSKLAQIACSVRIWDVDTERVITDLSNVGCSSAISWSPNGRQIAVAEVDNIISLWDAETFSSLKSLEEHSDQINVVSWHPDNTKVASGSSDMTVKIWDSATGQILHDYSASMRVYTIAWNSAGDRIAVGGSGDKVQVWEAENERLVQSISLDIPSPSVNSLAWSPDDEQLAIAMSGTILIWDTVSEQIVETIDAHDGAIDSIIWSPDGTQIFSVGKDNMIRAWYIETTEMLAERKIEN